MKLSLTIRSPRKNHFQTLQLGIFGNKVKAISAPPSLYITLPTPLCSEICHTMLETISHNRQWKRSLCLKSRCLPIFICWKPDSQLNGVYSLQRPARDLCSSHAWAQQAGTESSRTGNLALIWHQTCWLLVLRPSWFQNCGEEIVKDSLHAISAQETE